MNKKISIIGFPESGDLESTLDYKHTLHQIEDVKKYKLNLVDTNGDLLTWKDIDDMKDEKTIFQAILGDRKLRVDNDIEMADRPNFAVLTIINNSIDRLEYYGGHDSLQLMHDIRAGHLCNRVLENYMIEDKLGCDRNFENNPFLSKLGISKQRELGSKVNIIHDEQINVEYDKYLVRPTITLFQHQVYLFENMHRILTM